MAISARSIIQESPIIQDIDVIDYSLDATGDSLKYSSSPYTLKNLYKLLFSIPKIIGEKNRRKGSEKFNGSDIILTGTITSSGVAVTGSGTQFTTELEIGDWIAGSSGEFREVASIISDTSLTLSNAFTSDILTGQSISRMQYFSERMDRIERHHKLIGEPFALVTSNIPDSKYFIELTKDLTGSGLYNEGKLTGQASVDVSQQRYYTAVVNDSDSPLYGDTIKLSNSVFDISSGSEVASYCFFGAGETSGVFIPNQSQSHRHTPLSGASLLSTSVSQLNTSSGPYNLGNAMATTGNPTTDGTNGTYRGGKFTIPNTITAKFYMRIK